MVELLVSQSIHALQDMNKTVHSATPVARLVTMELDQFVGVTVLPVGLILAHSVKSGQTLREKDAAAQSSVAVEVVLLDTLTLVALATEVHKLKLKIAMVVELESPWFVPLLRILTEVYVIQNARLDTPESVQYVGKIVSVTPLIQVLHALRSHMAELLVSQ